MKERQKERSLELKETKKKCYPALRCKYVRESGLEADSRTKNPLPHRGLEPASLLRLSFRSDAVPTELSGLPQVQLTLKNADRELHPETKKHKYCQFCRGQYAVRCAITIAHFSYSNSTDSQFLNE